MCCGSQSPGVVHHWKENVVLEPPGFGELVFTIRKQWEMNASHSLLLVQPKTPACGKWQSAPPPHDSKVVIRKAFLATPVAAPSLHPVACVLSSGAIMLNLCGVLLILPADSPPQKHPGFCCCCPCIHTWNSAQVLEEGV